ncbi:MAG: ADP-ribosylglycohydrolase family protein [Clostridiales bacterium]|nr:ADP-ribosylglycohydrolase family protein [Clostridiales bacterium]
MNRSDNPYAIGGPIFWKMPMERTSIGAWAVTSKWEIQHADYIFINDVGNGKARVVNLRLEKYFYDADIDERTHSYVPMLGAICGDIAGSVYEWHNIKYVPDVDRLIQHRARFTDDSVMTLAVAVGLKNGLQKCGKRTGFTSEDEDIIREEVQNALRFYGQRYPHAGYGGSFRRWLASPDPKPYNSWGNGSAMRASFAGWAAKTLEDAELLGRLSAEVTHNHPEGVKGAVAVSGGIFTLLHSKSEEVAARKEELARYEAQHYDLNFTLDEIRPDYSFDVSCQGSVPQAIRAFLEGNSYEEVIALAISIGGDSDTIGAIAGSLAAIVYPISEGVRDRVLKRLDDAFKKELAEAIDFIYE